jgi:hypothetical protein
MIRAGDLPKNRRYLRAYLNGVRTDLIRDLGPLEDDLTTAQKVLIDRSLCLLSIIRCIEEYVAETSVIRGRDLTPVLRNAYLQYSESLRRCLSTLGIETRKSREILDLGAYVEAKDKEKAVLGQRGAKSGVEIGIS